MKDGIQRGWAFQKGLESGKQGNTVERGLMAFGLGCASDSETERNTRSWLAGFDEGYQEFKTGSLQVVEGWMTP